MVRHLELSSQDHAHIVFFCVNDSLIVISDFTYMISTVRFEFYNQMKAEQDIRPYRLECIMPASFIQSAEGQLACQLS